MKANKIFLISFIFSLIILSSGCLQPQRSPIPKQPAPKFSKVREAKPEEFLRKSYKSLNINHLNPKSLTLLDSSLKNNEVFFVGEIHGIIGNELIDIEMLKYLKKKVGIKYYLSEMGPASAYFYNQYLATGDEKLLNRLYAQVAGTVGWTKETYDAWKSFYKFNQSLPPHERIRLVGIDIQHQYDVGVLFLNDILPAAAPPNEIAAGIKHLKEVASKKSQDPNEIRALANELDQDIKSQKEIYESYLGDKFFDYSLGVTNLIYVFNFMDIEQDYVRSAQLRDNYIYNNFLAYYNHLPKGKYYGLWGRPHAYQRQQDQVNYIASLMNQQSSPVKGKVLSVAIFYKDCKRIFVNPNGAYDQEAYSDEKPLTSVLAKTTKDKVTLFKLTGPTSPYQRRLYIVDYPTGGGSTVNYFQYVIFIKNSGPSKPLKQH